MRVQTYRKSLQGQDGGTASQDAESVLERLRVKHGPAWQADDPRVDTLRSQFLRGLERDADLTSRAHDRQRLALHLMHDVASLRSALDGRRFEVRQVLAREREDRRRLLARKRDVVRGGGLIAVSGAPEVEVGDRAQVNGGFDGLVGRAVLAETNGVVRAYGSIGLRCIG